MKRQTLIIGILGILIMASGVGLLAQAQGKEDASLLLNVGDKRFKDKTLDIVPGQIFSAETGAPVTFARMVQELAACRFVFVGETHNSLPMHDIQLAVIKALYEKDRNVAVGLEMYPATVQEPLNKWSLGLLTDEEFLTAGQWYVNWNFNFAYYRRIFDFCKEMKLPVRGLNVPREIITKIRMGGWEGLSDEQKALVPALDLTNQDHRKLIRTVFESAELPPQMKGMGLDMVFDGLYRSQVAWDSAMAANARKTADVENRRVVVLAGSGHLLFNLGINLRVYEKSQQPAKTIVCVAVPADKKTLKVARGLADFVWGIPEEKRPAFPDIGLAFKKFPGLDNLVLERKPIDGAGVTADFEKGDIVLSVDGKPYADINTLRIYLSKFAWDQEVKFHILRAGQEKDVTLKLVEPPPPPPAK
jgi:uncharacterized iron-regulated protein